MVREHGALGFIKKINVIKSLSLIISHGVILKQFAVIVQVFLSFLIVFCPVQSTSKISMFAWSLINYSLSASP